MHDDLGEQLVEILLGRPSQKLVSPLNGALQQVPDREPRRSLDPDNGVVGEQREKVWLILLASWCVLQGQTGRQGFVRRHGTVGVEMQLTFRALISTFSSGWHLRKCAASGVLPPFGMSM